MTYLMAKLCTVLLLDRQITLKESESDSSPLVAATLCTTVSVKVVCRAGCKHYNCHVNNFLWPHMTVFSSCHVGAESASHATWSCDVQG